MSLKGLNKARKNLNKKWRNLHNMMGWWKVDFFDILIIPNLNRFVLSKELSTW